MDEKLNYLMEQIEEELDDAEEYAHNAMRFAHSPELSKTLLSLSAQELEHAQVLQGVVVKHMQSGEITAEVKHVHDYMRSWQDKHIKRVKMLHEIANRK